MSSVKVPEVDLREVDICDAELESDEESGVFENASENRGGFHNARSHHLQPHSESPSRASGPPRRCLLSDAAVKAVCLEPLCHEAWTRADGDDGRSGCRSSIVDCLLVELYDTYSSGKGLRSADSLDSSTEASGSDAFLGRSNTASSFLQELQEKHTKRHQRNYLSQKDPEELKWIIQEVNYRIGIQSAKLVRQLKRKDRLHHKQQKKCDIVTACLQAVSPKRRVDTRLKFTLEPSLGKNGFQQWYDALKAVARLPTGIPKEWRKRVWLTLADQYLHSISIDWEKTMRFAFNDRSNPDDDSLGIQIVKDLHRTGCSSYCGQEAEQDRVVLKRVLLAYARWNKTVGYCQGFNVLAALILEVTEGNEGDALKVMIYLIDKVLPESYFANNLRALSVDMAVFRDLLRLKLPELSQHLHHLQKVANRTGGGSYEPPLTNVFTMQWFLTMFATCLPHHTVLKIWDSVFFEGSEVLLRVALAIWAKLAERIEECQTADEFYSTMGCLTQEMLEDNLIDSNELMQTVYSMATFPFPQLAELREKYTYNITPFPAAVKAIGSQGLHGWESDDDGDMDDEDSIVTALGCLGPLGGLLAPEIQRYQKHLKEQRGEQSSPCSSMAELSPGAVGAARAEHHATINSMMMERMSTDIRALTKQYYRIKRRQQQQANLLYIHTDKCPATGIFASQIHSSPVVNHLLLGKKAIAAQHPCRNGMAQGLKGPTGSLPQAQSTPTQDHSLQSPWRAHVCAHRRNLARARAQLGFDDSVELEDNNSPEHKPKREEGEEKMKEEEDQEKERKDNSESQEKADVPLQEPVQGIVEEGDSEPQLQNAGCSQEIKEVEQQLSTLDLDSSAKAPSELNDPETPSLNPEPEMGNNPLPQPKPNAQPYVSAVACSTRHDSSSSESTACSLRQSSSVASTPEILPKPQQIFSPFPCVKVPRKSMAARNLGLYGPTSRTPSVHFPHMSKTMNRMGAGVAASTRRR
ncbi:TBC1 domain family member 30 isoform X2 [Pangasianodon hypophthalmus]|uniref:TBC1 domain family member 30 isoform X2 n=1 Tax=Pangasianodon hypophthalmus TaxID=310915 RepID=UPI000F001F9E|nr:TBC1 domain family member 30 isoform X2 [Pangasianodon hypophthalmus]